MLPFPSLPALLLAFAPQAPAASSEGPPARALLLELTSTPRWAGTSGSRWGADLVARRLAEAGWQVELDQRVVLLSLPRRVELALYEGDAAAPFLERIESFDPDAVPAGDVPLYSAYSASGSARAPVVDVGRGLRADYERLKAAGIDVRGAIALARYGGAYRGVKADLAQEFGCVGVLLYSDPAGDGDERGATWPEGPWKPDWDAQRGSIAPMARAPGDPSTPGWASPKPGEHGKRLTAAELEAALPRILCTPIGARDARALQARLQHVKLTGADGKESELPVGPGPVQVRLTLDLPRDLRTIHNVIARLPGRGEGLVLAGNHRDAWVRGAHDAGSGTVALLRAAQRLGERSKAGWKPQHTLVLGFWDAEEFGLIGSTEWGEAHAELLRAHGLAYVNADTAVGGPRFGASGTPGLLGALERALAPMACLTTGEGTPTSLWAQWVASFKDGPPRLGLPGSGSDFAVFLHHLGMPVLDIGFDGNDGGQYHTRFDDFLMVERYLDPGFRAHEAAGEFFERLLADLADDPAAGFDGAEAARAMAAHARASGLDAAAMERLATAFEDLARAWQGERAMTSFYRGLHLEEGLAGRPWFRNPLWAPGSEAGYGAETFPELRAAALRGPEELAGAVDALCGELAALGAAWHGKGSGR